MESHSEKPKLFYAEQQNKTPGFIDVLRAHAAPMKSSSTKTHQTQFEKQRGRLVAHDWEGLTAWPKDRGEQEKLGETLDLDLLQQFRNGLPEHLRNAYDAREEHAPELDAQLDKQFNHFLLSQAQVIGARLLLSDLVRLWVIWWSDDPENGICYLEKFWKAIVQYAKVRFGVGNAHGEVNSGDWRQAKADTKDELAALQKEIMTGKAKRNRTPKLETIKTILQNAEMYPSLYGNLTSLLAFCRQNRPLFAQFANGGIKPAPFFDEWAGWATNRDPESVRQKISGRK